MDVRVASGPDVDKGATKGASKKGNGQQRGETKQSGGGICEQPGKMSTRRSRLLKHARIALNEEDVEE